MNSNVNNLDDWEKLINAVDKSDIPIEFVNCIDIELFEPIEGDTSLSIDVKKLREEGYEYAEIDDITKTIIDSIEDNIKTMNFFLDIDLVATTIQTQTNIILNRI